MPLLKERESSTSPSATPLPSPLLGTITLLVLSGVFPLLIIANTPTNGYESWVGAAVVMVLVGARFAWIIDSRQRRLFEMTTWLYFYLFLGAAPLVQMRERVDPGTTPGIEHALDGQTIAIVLISAVGIMTGSTIAKRKAAPLVSSPVRSIRPGRTTVLTLAVLAFTVYYVARLGPATLFASRDARAAVTATIFPDTTTSAIASAVVSMGLLVSVVAQLAINRQRKTDGKKGKYLLLALTTVMLFAFVNPISMARYVFGTVLLGYLAALGLYGTARRFRLTALSSIAGLLFLFPLLDLFRRSLDATVEFQNPLDSMLSGDYDSFAQINNTVLYVSQEGTTMGRQALGVLLFWVPRSVWPTKPVDTGILLADHRGYGFSNLSAPLPAELFINGGWAVLILGMVAFGFGLRRWDAATERSMLLTGIPTMLGCIVPFYLLIVLRGSLLQSMASLGVILVMAWFVRGPNPQPKDSQASKSARSGSAQPARLQKPMGSSLEGCQNQ